MKGDLGRPNQKTRTRKDLLRAAANLMRSGRAPTLEEVAAEAMVSRATAYRYFPNIEALLVEAPLEMALPEAGELFGDAHATDPVARLNDVDDAITKMIAENEAPLRLMLAHTVQRPLREEGGEPPPVRQNRRLPLIEAALAPARDQLAAADELSKALSLIIGTEAMIVFKDVLQLDDIEARRVRRWAIRALVEAARRR